MQKAKCEELAECYPHSIVLQLRGGFYNAFDDSAVVLASIMGYKLNVGCTGRPKAGFPADAADKVIAELERNHVNYVFFDSLSLKWQQVFEDNRFLEFYDENSIVQREKGQDSEKEKVLSNTVTEKEMLEELTFINLLCEGRNPFTGELSDMLPLNDAKIVRMLYRIRDLMNKSS